MLAPNFVSLDEHELASPKEMRLLALMACVASSASFLTPPSPSLRSRVVDPRMKLSCSVRNQLRSHRRHDDGPFMIGTAGAGGGDIYGGADPERNAQLASLKKMFFQPDEEQTGPIHDSGLMLDMPLCRWSWVLLPGQQLQLNVWQPQYTLMFEKILSAGPPYYYHHVLLPGGAESLGDPKYELRPGTQAPLAGTLCRIVLFQREPDGRLSLVVQGLARGLVLKETQALPYARGHVQLLPDAEALLAGARAAAALVDSPFVAEPMAAEARRLLAMTAAAKELVNYFDYEAALLAVDSDGGLSPVTASSVVCIFCCVHLLFCYMMYTY